jgi:hypothetical protein
VHSAVGEVVHEQVGPHAGRHAEHGGKPEADGVLALHQFLFDFHLLLGVEGDGPQRRLLRAEVVLVAGAVSTVGGGHQDALLAGDQAQHQRNRVVVGGGGPHRVERAQRRADQGGQWDHHVGLRDQRRHGALDADVSLHDAEAGVVADVIEARLLEHEVVHHSDLVARGQQVGHHRGAQVSGAARDENVVGH